MQMIKPRHIIGKKVFTLNYSFIDREEAKQLYRDKLAHNEKDYNILCFYGVGGVGKSTLREELRRIHIDENEDSLYMYLDLNLAEDRCMEKGILKLVDSCTEKVTFKTFELAYAIYFKKKYPGDSNQREKELISENSIINIGRNIISVFDGGITSVSVELIERAIRKISREWIEADVKEELKALANCSVSEIEERLPMFFEYDLQQYIKKKPEVKILIVFDTFEALNENVIEKVHRSKNERWIQDIIAYFPREKYKNLLITIFGRDKIVWGSEWDSLIDQYKLDEFTDDYSVEYLTKANITEEEIRKAIIKSSKGLPLLLYLMTETYFNIKNDGRIPQVDDFDGNYPRIIERFLYNLDKDTVNVLRLVSVPNFYNREIFKLLICEYNVSYSMMEFEQFNRYSFVLCEENNEKYYIHKLIRDEILKQTDKNIIESAHLLLRNYYYNKLSENLENEAFAEMFFHASHVLDIESFNQWIVLKDTSRNNSPIDIMKKMQVAGEQGVLIQVIGNLINQYGLNDLDIQIVNIYIDIVHLGGDYRRSVMLCDEFLGKFPDTRKNTDQQLIKMRIRQIHHSMFFKPVNELINSALAIMYSTEIQKYPEEYNELLFLIGGNLGILSGDFIQADIWLGKSMEYAKTHNLIHFEQRTIRKQVDLLIHDNKEKLALEQINDYLPQGSALDTRYKIYLTGSKGEAYRKLGELDKAYECYDVVEKKSSEYNLMGWKAHALMAKGIVKMMQSLYSEADNYFLEAETIYKKIQQRWGIINVNTAKILLDLCKGNGINYSLLEECRQDAVRMGYKYNIDLIDEINNKGKTYMQLFFL